MSYTEINSRLQALLNDFKALPQDQRQTEKALILLQEIKDLSKKLKAIDTKNPTKNSHSSFGGYLTHFPTNKY